MPERDSAHRLSPSPGVAQRQSHVDARCRGGGENDRRRSGHRNSQ
ncbi:hypothetical protein L083_3597 [Actinoplanes sp. N902-109]|nr:hypothetical protein L083_3597 [Actinoplanes sp. N902-109]